MQRAILGLLAVGALAAGILIEFVIADPQYQTFGGFCMKIGGMLAVLWLALPEVRQPKNWLWLMFLAVALLVLAWRPRLLPLVLGVFVTLAILRPRSRKQTGTHK